MIASLRRIALQSLFALATAVASFPLFAADDSGVLVLGRISDDPKKHYEQLKPLLDYVVSLAIRIRPSRIPTSASLGTT